MIFATPSPELETTSYARAPEVLRGRRLDYVLGAGSGDEQNQVATELATMVLPIEGESAPLRLRQPLVIQWKAFSEGKVLGWGITLDWGQLGDIERLLARRFLELWRKAERRCLSESERQAWLHITDAADLSAFYADREMPRYVEGVCVKRFPHVRIEWHDGYEEQITRRLVQHFSVLEEGDWFSGHARFGPDGKLTQFQNLRRLLPDETVIPDAWP